jgi:hypothetical protein
VINFGGMSNGDSFAITIGVNNPFFNMSGYRYLKLSNCLTTAAQAQTRLLTINGKTWPLLFPYGTAGAVIVDLCNPVGGGALSDTTDSILAPGDPNPTLGGGGGTDGPLWGVTYVQTLSISGFGSGSTETFGSIDLITENDLSGQFITTWEPRFGNMPQYGPSWPVGTDFTAMRAENRSAILITDGRQSCEWDGQSALDIDGSPSPFSATAYSIARTIQKINAGYILDGGAVGQASSQSPYYQYFTVPNGWTATQVIPSSDCSENIFNGYMNTNLPASWLYGDGVIYLGPGPGQGFATGIGVNPSSVPVQMLISSIDFYPGCGDVFSFGGPSASPNVVYLVASKIYRSQAWGILINGNTQAPLPHTSVLLLPTPGEAQPPGMVVGTGVSDVAEGIFRTSGAGLNGIQIVSSGSLYYSTASTGNVQTTTLAGVVTVVEQTFQEQKLSRVAIKTLPSGPIPPGDPSGAGPGPCLQRSPDMGGPWS